MRYHRNELLERRRQSAAMDTSDPCGEILSHSRESGKLYLIRDVRKEDENTLIGQLVVLQLPDSFCLFQDAGLWCAVPPGFQDFDEDPIGRGSTQREAVQNLVARAEFQKKAARNGWNKNPSLAEFTVLEKSAERPYQLDSPVSEH